MINEEADYYTEDGSSQLSNPIDSGGSHMIEYEEEDEFATKYRKEQIFQEIDFSRRKTKITCTLGYVKNISLFVCQSLNSQGDSVDNFVT